MFYRVVKDGDLDWQFDNHPTDLNEAAYKAMLWNEGFNHKVTK